MSFGQPLWFCALAIVPFLLAAFWGTEVRRAKLLRQFVAARLQERLAGSVSIAMRRLRFALALLGLVCVIVSLAEPRYGYTWQQSKRRGRDILIAIDTSKSMLATDLAPSRLGRAKLAAQDLIGQLHGDRVGIIAFAGSTFLQAPLTADVGAVVNALNELDTDIIPLGGTNIAEAIKAAADAFGKGESDYRSLIIFTDGEELDFDGVRAAERVNGSIRIFTVGLGSADGSLIPLPGRRSGDFVKDEQGQFVKSKLDEERLRKIAESSGGFYVHLLNGPAEMQQIVRDGLGQMTEKDIDEKFSRQPIERYQWPLSVALACFAMWMLLGERKRAMKAMTRPLAGAVAALLLAPAFAGAAANSGVAAYERDDFKGAEEQFAGQLKRQPGSEPLHFDLGAAAYKAGEYDRALESFARAVTSPDPQLRTKAEYNLANTLYQRGAAQKDKEPKVREWKGAIQHYDEALKVDPKNADAAYNRDVLQQMIEALEKEPPKDDQQKKDDKKKDEQNKDQQKNQQQQNQDQQKQDQKNQDKDQQQKGGEQKQDQQAQSDHGEKKDGQPQEQKDPQSKDGQSKPDQQEPGEKKDGKEQDKDAGKKDGDKDSQAQPQPGDEKPGPKKEGQVGAASPSDKPADDAQQQAEAEALAAAENKMTPQQAKALLDSLKGEDDHVQLRDPNERRPGGRVLHDW